MKKMLILVAFFATTTIGLFATEAPPEGPLFCVVHPNPARNSGFCQAMPDPQQGNGCMMTGPGPACWITGGYD